MVKQIGENSPSSILNSIQVPQLTDFATGNYQNVIEKTLDNYKQAMTSLEAKMTVDNSTWKSMRQKNEDYAAQVEAVNRANAQSKQGGSDWGSALANVGKSLVSGLIANEQLQAQKEQQAFENNLATEKLNLTKEEIKAKKSAEEQAAAHEQLTTLVQARLSEIEGEAYRTIQKGSYEQGISYAEAQVGSLMSDPLFASMSDANKFYVASLGQSFLTRIRKENLTQTRGEAEKIEDSTITLAQTQFQYQNVSLLKGIENGAGVLDAPKVEQSVKTILQSAQDIVANDPSLTAILTDKSKYVKYYSGILSQVNDALGKYYGQAGQWTQQSETYREAMTQLSLIETLRGAGKMTEGEYQRSAVIILTGLGISPDVSKIPTTQVNVARSERERQQEIERQQAAVTRSENLRTLNANNPQFAQANKFNLVSALFNTISNQNGQTIEQAISSLEYSIKEQPDVAQARDYNSQLSLLKTFRTDRIRVSTLREQAAKLEGELAALNFKINPPKLEQYIQPAGTPLGTSQGVSPRAEVQYLDNPTPIPGASKEQFEAKARELQEKYNQITEVASKWADNGINIFNLTDRTYLNKLDAETKAARDAIKQSPEYQQHNPNSGLSPTTQQNTQTPEVSKLAKALEFEVRRNGYQDVTVNYIQHSVPKYEDRVKLVKPIQDRVNELDSKYQNAINVIQQAYSDGATADVQEVIDTLVYNKAGMSEGQIKLMDGMLKEQTTKLTNLNKLLQSKSQWYRQKFGEDTQSRPPTNFSSGSEPKPASQTPLPTQRQALASEMPLAGNLAKTSFGYVPFKGGNITYISDFQGRQRFGTKKRPKHNGIDIVSSDPRVSTIQGGTVVFAKEGLNGGYGNLVIVKAGDGTYELFGHLKSINVKKDDNIDPATQIGIMGNSGNSTGAHVHFGVTTSIDLKTFTSSTWLDPVQYLQKVTGKVTLPRGQGASPNQGSNVDTYDNSMTGFYTMSNNLTYMSGYVLDRTTGKIRKATQSERANVSNYTPIGTITRGSNNQPTQANYNSSSGETITERYRIPKQAESDGDFLFVHPTGRKASNGNVILAVEGYRKGKKVFAVEAVSGATGISTNRHQPGQNNMLPDGTWNVARDTIAGASAAVGDQFLPLSYVGKTGRADIGIHVDGNNNKVTAGCIATFTIADRDKIYQFVRNTNRQLRLYVNTQDVERVTTRASSTNTPTGNSTSSPVVQASPYRSAYSGKKNDPTANYGYQTLKDNPAYARALAEGADKAGVPAVWLADLIDSESSWNNIQRTDGKAAGLFQATPETLGWLGRATIGRPMTKQEFINKGVVWQLSVAFPTYLNIVSKDAGKGYNSMGDVLAAVWGGKRSLARDPRTRQGNVYEGRITWNMRMNKMGRRVGRSYDPQASLPGLPTIIHDNPRDTCALCNQMLLNGSFTTHSVKGIGEGVPNNYA
jgi:murein DD-endopeptidase MepM/ murein hydrolase activator NlpD